MPRQGRRGCSPICTLSASSGPVTRRIWVWCFEAVCRLRSGPASGELGVEARELRLQRRQLALVRPVDRHLAAPPHADARARRHRKQGDGCSAAGSGNRPVHVRPRACTRRAAARQADRIGGFESLEQDPVTVGRRSGHQARRQDGRRREELEQVRREPVAQNELAGRLRAARGPRDVHDQRGPRRFR